MEEFWILILMAFFVTNSLDKAETVQLEELSLQTFDELFVDEWLDKDEAAEDLERPPTIFGQTDHSGQIEPNSTDQNAPLTESDHSDNAKNCEEQNEMMREITSNEKRKIIDKFHVMKEEFKKKGKYSKKERTKIEDKIARHSKVNRSKIYEWKKEFGLSRKMHNFEKKKEERKHLIEKFDQRKAELKRDGFKSSYQNELDKTVAKELGLSYTTIYNWKRELGQTTPKKYSNSKQMELMKRYYEIKDQNYSDADIAKMLKIGRDTLRRWKKQFKRHQFHPNSVDGHSVEENAATNVQEIDNSNAGSI